MSHDLHLAVQNGSQSSAYDQPIGVGGMDHLPDQQQPPPSGSASSSPTNSTLSGNTLRFVEGSLKQSSHPFVIIFHLLFKGLSLFVYMFGGWMGGNSNGANFIVLTVVCILLLAADFWVTKNVTGRFLVGLRWWNKVDNDRTEWIFESSEGRKQINAFDRNIFWTVLYATTILWIVLFIWGFIRFKFNWLLIVIMALALNGSNVYGYYKCSKEQKEKLNAMIQEGTQRGAMMMMQQGMMSMLTGGITGTKPQQTQSTSNIV